MAAKTGLQARLAELQKKWKGGDAERAASAASGVPDGTYIARLSEASLSDGNGGLRSLLVFTILEGEYAGEFLRKSDGLEQSEDSMVYFGKTLMRLGYEPKEVDLTTLPEIFKDLTAEKPVCEVNARTKTASDYQNYFVNRVLEDYEGADEDEESGEIEEGSQVSGTFRDVEYTGVVTGFVGDTKAKVKRDDTGATITVLLENLTLVAADEEEEAEEAEEAEEDEESEDAELEVGMRVEFTWKKQTETGTVTAIVDAERAKVKIDSSGAIATVKIENLELLDSEETDEEEAEEVEEEEEEEEAPAPKKRGSRTPAPAPAPAPTPAKKKTAAAPVTPAKPATRRAK